ncbi:hypothetical protein [Bacteroides sp.]|uniref:hypothetical protein n=1 Tax=Bacteroides sp. TaxID=29523 RepID=UPI002FC6E83F
MKKTAIYFLSVLFLFIGGAIYITIHNGLEYTKTNIQEQIQSLLQEAIQENASFRTKDIPFWGGSHEPEKIGTYQRYKITLQDTTYICYNKITDIETTLSNKRQVYLLSTRALHSEDVRRCFEKLLNKRGIHAPNAVYIHAKDYRNKIRTDMAQSMPKMNLNSRVHYAIHESLNHISYFGYVDYSGYTLWRLMPKALIYALLALEIIILSGILFIYIVLLKRKEIPEESRNNDEIISTSNIEEEEALPLEVATLRLHGHFLLHGEKRIKLPQQLRDLMQMFMKAKENRVEKIKLKRYWTKRHGEDAQSNMTTAIYRLNKRLAETGVPYKIAIDMENKDFYRLQVHSTKQ